MTRISRIGSALLLVLGLGACACPPYCASPYDRQDVERGDNNGGGGY